jgi:hypothetical protein
VVDDELVERRARGDKHGGRFPRFPAGPARPLPGAGDRPGIPGQDGHVEASDVDAELQGVRRDDPQDLSLPQALLDLPPLEGQIAAPVSADEAFILDGRLDVFLEVGEEDLGVEPALGEDDRLRLFRRKTPATRLASLM